MSRRSRGRTPDRTHFSRSDRPFLRVLAALGSTLPLIAVGAYAVHAPQAPSRPVTQHITSIAAGPTTLSCPGPLVMPDPGAAGNNTDDQFALTPPSNSSTVRAVAIDGQSPLLFGQTLGATTTGDIAPKPPQLRLTGDAAAPKDAVKSAAPLAIALGTLATSAAQPGAELRAGGTTGMVADTVQSTITPTGDFRSATLARCAPARTDATFAGLSTANGKASLLVLTNPSSRPATVTMTAWGERGPVVLPQSSHVVVPARSTQNVLLDALVPNAQSLTVRMSTNGIPVNAHVQITGRNGLTPQGAVHMTADAVAASDSVLAGIQVTAGAPAPRLSVTNSSASPAHVTWQVQGSSGDVPAGAGRIDVPAGTVSNVELRGLTPGSYALALSSETPVAGVVTVDEVGTSPDGPGQQAPQDFAVVTPAAGITDAAALAVPVDASGDSIVLTSDQAGGVSLIPVAADGTAGTPSTVEVGRNTALAVPLSQLSVKGSGPAAVILRPDVPGAVHAALVHRPNTPHGPLLSVLPYDAATTGQHDAPPQIVVER
ncbi:DUF5719 family protein [Devriesea agamarum]|uniref:DUF5719 family protein n=1 Tax=Devriesea agamarum TaxID=472569 RepID=UPI00071C3E6C|nr:DUF5719 family protein [Devriesea agamarum]